MKVSVNENKKIKKAQFQLCIGLEPDTKRIDDDDDKKISFICKMNPTDKDSPKFSVKIHKYGDDSTVRQLLETFKQLDQVVEGQGAKSHADQVKLVR